MLEERIKALLNEQNKKVKDLCAYIGMTDTAIRKMYARDSCEISTLIKIAGFFDVSPCYFFDSPDTPSVHATHNSIAVGGNATDVNSFRAVHEIIGEVTAQRKMTEKALEQVDRLVGVIERMNEQNKSSDSFPS